MKIVADIDLPLLDEMFAGRADVERLKGDAITPAAVRDADAIIVRSLTRVDDRLLSGSRVRFVGTATIGTDHVDTAWLASAGIRFASAPGCNAAAVSEYVAAALLELAERFDFRLRGTSIGIVGCGNVGERVAGKMTALGMTVLLNDPPLARATGGKTFVPLDALMACDVVTLHVPLTRSGPDATLGFFDERRIGAMKRGAVLINTSRGRVVDEPALSEALAQGRLRAAALDVWDGEPSVNLELLARAAIGTAHIAGYSADAKTRASTMMYDALCAHMGWERRRPPGDRLPPPMHPVVVPNPQNSPETILREIVRLCYPIARDDAALRKVAGLPPSERPGYFIGLRNEYPLRREFPATAVTGSDAPGFPARELAGLGFRLT